MMPRPKDPRLPNRANRQQQELDKGLGALPTWRRKIWGEVTTKNGRKAARNRAIISTILGIVTSSKKSLSPRVLPTH
jgi:hypothetical protein